MSDDNEDPNKKSTGEKRKQDDEEEGEPLDLSSSSPLKRSRSYDEQDRPNLSADRIPLGPCIGDGYNPTIYGITPIGRRLSSRSRQIPAVAIQDVEDRELETANTLLGLRESFIATRRPSRQQRRRTMLPPPPPPGQTRKPMSMPKSLHVPHSPTYPPPSVGVVMPQPSRLPLPPPARLPFPPPLPTRPPPPPTPLPFVRLPPGRNEMPPLVPIPPEIRARYLAGQSRQLRSRFADKNVVNTDAQPGPSTSRGVPQEWHNNFPNNNQPLMYNMNPPPPGTVQYPYGWPIGVPLPQMTQPMVQMQPQPVSVGFYPQPHNIVPVMSFPPHHMMVNNPQQHAMFRHPAVMMNRIVHNRQMVPFMQPPMAMQGHGNFIIPMGNRTYQQTAELWRPFQLPGPVPPSHAMVQTAVQAQACVAQTTVSQLQRVETSVVQTFIPMHNPQPGPSHNAAVMNVAPCRRIFPRNRSTAASISLYNEEVPLTPRNQLIPTFQSSPERTDMVQPVEIIPPPEGSSEESEPDASHVEPGPETPRVVISVQSAIVELNEFVSRIMDISPRGTVNLPRQSITPRCDDRSGGSSNHTAQQNQFHIRRTGNDRVMRRPQTPRGAPFYYRCPFPSPMETASTSTIEIESVGSYPRLIYPERPESPSILRAQATREIMGTPQRQFVQFVRPSPRARTASPQTPGSATSPPRYSSSWPPTSPSVGIPRRSQQPTPLYHQYNSTTYLPNIPQGPRAGYTPPRAKYYVPGKAPALSPDIQFEESPVIERPVQIRISEDPEDPNNWDVDVNKILEILQNVTFDGSDDEMDSETTN